MFKRGLALTLVLGMATVANAGATLEVNLLTPENGPGGYLPGTAIDFSVGIATDRGVETQVRLLNLDFSATSPELTLTGPDNFNIGLPVPPAAPDGIMEFVFDYVGNGVTPGLTGQFPNYPVPNLTYQSGSPIPTFMFIIPATGFLTLGTGQVTTTAEGNFLIDPLNANSDSDDNNISARLDFDFANPTTWTANGSGADLITGGITPISVVPEPATLALLGLGGLVALRRRKK